MLNTGFDTQPAIHPNAQKFASDTELVTLQLDTAKIDVACSLDNKVVLEPRVAVAHAHNSRTVVAQCAHMNPIRPADTVYLLRGAMKSLNKQGQKLGTVWIDMGSTFRNAEFLSACRRLGIEVAFIPGTRGFVTERYFRELNAFLRSSAGIRMIEAGEMDDILDTFAKDIYGGTRKH